MDYVRTEYEKRRRDSNIRGPSGASHNLLNREIEKSFLIIHRKFYPDLDYMSHWLWAVQGTVHENLIK